MQNLNVENIKCNQSLNKQKAQAKIQN